MIEKIKKFPEKAVVYLRVSSVKQEDGFSLDAQEKLARRYAQEKNLTIVKMWKVQESAWGKKERINFTEMLDFVKRNESVKHIIFDVVDRMTRNDNDKIRVILLIKKNHKTVHFSRTNQMLNADNLDSTKEFMMDVEVAAAKKLSNDIAYKTKMGMTEKAEQGIFPAQASLGYQNKKNKKGDAWIEVDPIAGPLVTELFEYASTGKYSYEELEEIFYAKGLRTRFGGKRVTLKSIEKVLHNPLYYGVFQWGGKLYKGTHQTLVTKDLWEKAGEAMRAKGHRFDTKHNYPFNRLVKCEHCGHYILGAASKGKYLYYRCAQYNKNHNRVGYLTESNLQTQLSGIVKDIELPKEVIQVLIKGLQKRGLKANRISANAHIILQQDLERTNKRLDNLLNMHLDNRICDAEYQAKHNELVKERARIESDLSTCQQSPEGAQRAMKGLEILSGLEKCYKKADNYGKADLLRAIGAQYILTAENQIAVEYKEPFKAIYQAKLKNGGGENSPLPNKKTALLNQGCLDIYDDKTTFNFSKSCSKNDWGRSSILIQTKSSLKSPKTDYQILRDYWKNLFFGDKNGKSANKDTVFIVNGFWNELQTMKEVYLAGKEYFV